MNNNMLRKLIKYGFLTHLSYLLFQQRHVTYIHKTQNIKAKKAIESIEKRFGKTNKNEAKKAIEYANDVLGSNKYTPWLLFYTAIRGEFIEGWIPFNYYLIEVIPTVNKKYKLLSLYKTLTNRILKSDNIPDIGYIIDKKFYDIHFQLIKQSDVVNYLFHKTDNIYYKPDNLSKGLGIQVINKARFDFSKIQANGVFQYEVSQNELFNLINNSSASTIRLTTVKKNNGDIELRSAYIRFSRINEKWVKSSTNIRVPIDIANGCMKIMGYDSNWLCTEYHPDSNYKFENTVVPNFETARKLVVELHRSFPQFTVIGWDLCIDKNEQPMILEWNTSQNHIVMPECTAGPIFSDLGWEHLWKKRDSHVF